MDNKENDNQLWGPFKGDGERDGFDPRFFNAKVGVGESPKRVKKIEEKCGREMREVCVERGIRQEVERLGM